MGTPSFRFSLLEPRPVRCNVDRLAALATPVLIVVPRDETLHDGPTMAQRLRQRLTHTQVELVDDANHIVVIDRTDLVEELLREFLRTS